MDSKTVYILGFVITAISIIAYLFRWKSKSELQDGILLCISSFGIVAGIQIFILTLGADIDLSPFKEYKQYLVLGSLASTWISIQTIYQCFKSDE